MKRKMTKFRLDEVSAVENPAQDSGKGTIIKNAKGEQIAKWDDVVDFVTSSTEGHVHGIKIRWDGEHAKMDCRYASIPSDTDSYKNHNHDIYYNDTTSQWELAENMGHTHTIDNTSIETVLEGIKSSFNISKSTSNSGVEKMTEEEKKKMEDEKKKMKKDLDDAQAATKRLESIISLSATQKAHFDTLEKTEDQDAFLAKSNDERDAVIAEIEKNNKSEDPVVFTSIDGKEYRKSAGEAVIEIAKTANELAKQNAVLMQKSEDAEIAKSAESILKNFSGEMSAKVAVLKAVKGIKDEATRKSAMDFLEKANTSLDVVTTTIGHNGEIEPVVSTDVVKSAVEASDKLEEIAKSIAKEEGLDSTTAYSEAMNRNPDLYEAASKA